MFCIESVIILQPELGNLCLAMRACLPADFRTFVSSDVDIFRREEFADFCENILKKLHGLLPADTQHIICYAPTSPYVIWATCTSVFRICCKSSKHVAGKVNLRDYGDALCSCISDDVSDLLLCVPAAFSVRSVVVCRTFEEVTYESLLSYGSYFSQFRIFLDFDSPSLVVCKVPVEGVELVYLHDIEVSLYFFNIEELA